MSTSAEDASRPLDLAKFAGSLAKSSLDWGKATSRDTTQLWNLLSSLSSALKEAHSEVEIDHSSALGVALAGCGNAMIGIAEFLNTLSHVANGSNPSSGVAGGKSFQTLQQLEDRLTDSINVLSLMQNIGIVRYVPSNSIVIPAHSSLDQMIFNI